MAKTRSIGMVGHDFMAKARSDASRQAASHDARIGALRRQQGVSNCGPPIATSVASPD
jgi:hypothetical protein